MHHHVDDLSEMNSIKLNCLIAIPYRNYPLISYAVKSIDMIKINFCFHLVNQLSFVRYGYTIRTGNKTTISRSGAFYYMCIYQNENCYMEL